MKTTEIYRDTIIDKENEGMPERPFISQAEVEEFASISVDKLEKHINKLESYTEQLSAKLAHELKRSTGLEGDRMELQAKLGHLTQINDLLMDSECDKIMALTDDQISAALRLKGRDPTDEATIGEQVVKLALLTVERNQLRGVNAELVQALSFMEKVFRQPAGTNIQCELDALTLARKALAKHTPA